MILGTSYVVENDERLAAAFARTAKDAKDLKIPLKLVGKDFRKSRTALFTLKGPGLYDDLAPSTKKTKKRKFGSIYPILVASGRLRDSVTIESHPENISRIGKLSADLGTRVPYGVYHQSDKPRTKIPLRKFLFVGPEAPRFARGNDLKGFPERALNTLNTYILRKMGANIEQATGTKPEIKK